MGKKNVLKIVAILIILVGITFVIVLKTQEKSRELEDSEVIIEYEIENTDEEEQEEQAEKTEIEETKEEIVESPVIETPQVEKTQQTSKAPTPTISNNTPATPVETPKQETKTEPIPEPVVQRCTNNYNHGQDVGNCGKWYSSKAEGIAEYNSKLTYWGQKWENYEIDTATYDKNCPSGYEIWSCPFCQKWTLNYYYR